MKMQRAYSLLTLKNIDEEKREITGIATTPTTDRMGDIVEPEGAEFQLPIPLLWQHNSREPIGEVYEAKVTSDGILVKARILKIDEPGKLKDRLDEAWQSIKYKLVKGLSIGFQPLETADIEGTWGYRFLRWMWLELSAVTIAANGEASIQTVKSIDRALLAASGRGKYPVVKLYETTPGASGNSNLPKRKEKDVKTWQEQIASFEAKRAATAARMKALMETADTEGRTLTSEEGEDHDAAEAELGSIDKHLARLRVSEKASVATATVIDGGEGGEGAEQRAAAIRGGQHNAVQIKPKLEKGIEFARFAMCLGAAKGNIPQAYEIAKSRYQNDGARLHTVLKAAVEAGTTTDATWAAPLVEYQIMASEFVEFLRPLTIIGRIPNLRKVPFNIKLPRQTTGGNAYWVGQGKPKPLSKIDFDSITLRWTKLATIAVLTEELVRFSNPSAEMLTRDALAGAIVQKSDEDFVDPDKAEVADTSPASITNGLVAVVSNGNDAESVRADIRALFAAFIASNLTPTNGVWIMSSTTALALSLMVNALGQAEFPGITMLGGTFWGMPVVTSESVPTDSTGAMVILANASDILLADDGQVVIDASREASLQMDDDPTNDSGVPTPTQVVSMFQTNSVAIRAERFINWKRRRPTAVAYLSGVNWGQPSS